jgi:predicted MFS family arabinose efflux permease
VKLAIKRAGGLGAFAEPSFRRVYLARALSLFGDGLVPVALAFGVLSVDPSPSTLGFVLASRFGALVPSLLIAGVVADRMPRKAVMIGSDLTRLVAQAAIAALLITASARPWELILLAALYGFGEAFFRPTVTGFIPEVVSAERMQQANALLATTTSVSTVAGPLIAGLLIVAFSPGWAIAVDALTFLASAVLLSGVSPRRTVRQTSATVWRDVVEGWNVFRSRTWLWVDGVYAALGNFAVLAPLMSLGPLVASRHLGGAGSWAAIVTALGLGSVLGGVTLLRTQPRRPLLVGVPLLALLALPPALLAVPAATPLIAAGAFAGGFGLAVFNTLFETTVQHHVEPAALSRVAAIDWLLSLGLSPFGFVAASLSASAFGVQVPLTVAAVWIVISTAVVIAIPDVRRLQRAPSGLTAENPAAVDVQHLAGDE